MPPVDIDPNTGERVQPQNAAAAPPQQPNVPQIDPATGERVGAPKPGQGLTPGGAVPKTTTVKPGPLQPIMDTIDTVGQHLGGLLTGPYHALMDPATDQEKKAIDTGDPVTAMMGGSSNPLNRLSYRTLLEPAANNLPRLSSSNPDMKNHPVETSIDAAVSSLPIVGPMVNSASNKMAELAQQNGNYSGIPRLSEAVPAAAGAATDLIAPRLLEMAPRAAGATTRGILARGVDEPIPGSNLTPRARFEAAGRTGVNLDAADATGNPLLTAVKRVNENSLFGSNAYDRAKAANSARLRNILQESAQEMSPHDAETGGRLLQDELRAPFRDLQNTARTTVEKMSPLSGEAGGARLQALAKERMDQMYDTAQNTYKDISTQYGRVPIENPSLVSSEANDILAKNSRFSQQFPSLESHKVMNVIRDVAQLGSEQQRAQLGPPRVSDLIRSRSALLDLTRDPEIVKSSYAGDIQRLIKAQDDAITSSLPEEGQKAWRTANSTWEEMKNAFDNPQSPYYHAIRTASPSSLTRGIGDTTPENMKLLQTHTGPEGVAIVRRGTAEKLLGNSPGGQFDLNNLGNRLSQMPTAYKSSLFGNMLRPLQDIADRQSYYQSLEKGAFDTPPEKLVQGQSTGPQTPYGVRQLGRMGVTEEGLGALRRGVLEKTTGTDAYGDPKLHGFGGRFNKLPEDYRNELFQGHAPLLQDVATTANTLGRDFNPSGTAKVGQKVGEAAAFLPTAGAPLLQYPVARAMNSPTVVQWLMKHPTEVPSISSAPMTPARLLPGVRGPQPKDDQNLHRLLELSAGGR